MSVAAVPTIDLGPDSPIGFTLPALAPVLTSVGDSLSLGAATSQLAAALPADLGSVTVSTQVNLGPVTSAVSGVAASVDLGAVAPSVSKPVGLAVPDAPPVPFIGPSQYPNQLVPGARLLQQLTIQRPGTLVGYIAKHRDIVASLLASPPPPASVATWWSALDLSQQGELRAASPSLVGNLDGIPYSIRDLANRALLSQTMTALQATITGESGRTVVENAKGQLRMLQSISDALGTASQPGGIPRSLLTLDVTGQGKAAIVIGDLRTADYVSYLVPGMFFTIENQMGYWTDAAAELYAEQRSWLALLDPDAAHKTVATIAWIGYHTPNLTNVGGIQNAEEGRDALTSAIEGLQSLRKGNEPYTTIIAHSYGSTAALMALTEGDFSVDALAMVGSPGSPAKSVTDLHVRRGHVWVGEAAWDPIPNSAYFGSDPGSKSYGARSLGVGGGLDSLTKQVLAASIGHNEYFSPGTESMRNFALIGINQGEYVTR